MRSVRSTVAVAASLSLLMLQLSGLHTHANENGFVGVPETGISHAHAHQHDHEVVHPDAHDTSTSEQDDVAHLHDYDGARDVSYFELAAGDIKLTVALLALALLFIFYHSVRALTGPSLAYPVLSGRHTRWRPPLRAPPFLREI